MNGRYSNSNSAMTFAISSANSYLHSESKRIDGSLNYFLWGKKIVENVIRFTFFFLFIDFDNMAIIVGPEQALQTQDRNDRRQFIRLHKRYTLESDTHKHTHTYIYIRLYVTFVWSPADHYYWIRMKGISYASNGRLSFHRFLIQHFYIQSTRHFAQSHVIEIG